MRTQDKIVDVILLVAGIFAAWQLLFWVIGESALSSPIKTMERLAYLLTQDWFLADTMETLRAIGIAAAISVVAGCFFGLVLGLNRFAGDVAEPLLAALYAIPKVTLYPIVLLLFGLTISARIAFGVMHGVIPIMLFTMSATAAVAPVLQRSAKIMRLTPIRTVTKIIIPAALPGIFTGLRIGISVTILGVLIGEMFASKRGLGFRLVNAMETHDITNILAIATLLTVFALVINYILVFISSGRRLSTTR